MPRLKIRVSLQPKQDELYDLCESSRKTRIGYGGSRGGAKSGGARRVMLKRRIEHPGTRGAIFRRTFSLVKENHIDKYLQEWPCLQEFYHVGDSEFRLPNGSVLAFRYANTQQDVDAHIGKEYMDIIVDQGEAFNEHEHLTLSSCCRWPGVDDAACKYIVTFNPGNIGHKFLQRIFFDKKYRMSDGALHTEQDGNKLIAADPELAWMENPEDYAFIQAYGWDNVEWARAALEKDGMDANDFYSWDSDKRFQYYIKRTQFGREQNALPQAMRLGWLLGRMDQFAGQYYDIFSPERHIVRCKPDPWHTSSIGIDWGFAHLSAAYWGSQIRERLFACYREFCGSGRSPRALAQEIVDRTPPEERPQIKHIYLSHDAFAQRTEQDTIADQMAQVFRQASMPYPEQASKDPMGRAALLYDLMGPIDPLLMQPKQTEIVIDPSCTKLIGTLPMVCRDPNYPEKPLKFEGDDPFDGFTHLLTARMKQAKVPTQVQIMEQANQIADPTARWFYLRKHAQEKPKAIVQPRVIMPWEANRR